MRISENNPQLTQFGVPFVIYPAVNVFVQSKINKTKLMKYNLLQFDILRTQSRINHLYEMAQEPRSYFGQLQWFM